MSAVPSCRVIAGSSNITHSVSPLQLKSRKHISVWSRNSVPLRLLRHAVQYSRATRWAILILTKSLQSLLTSSMITSPPNFQSILDVALDNYHKQTGIDLTKHPSAEQLENCHSPDDIVKLFLEREAAFKGYRGKYHKLIDCLRPVVKVVHAFAGILGEAAGLVSNVR